MKNIYKYELQIVDEQVINVPILADWIHVGLQGERLFVWAMLDPQQPNAPRKIRIIGTGHPIPDSHLLEHIGTVVGHLGGLVWHVFEKL